MGMGCRIQGGDKVTDYQQWIAHVTRDPHEPLTQERIDEMLRAANRAGAANGWSGTSGTLAAMVRELLRERHELMKGSEANGGTNERLPDVPE